MNSHFKEYRFFDWKSPFLPQVVQALLTEKTIRNRLDLSQIILTFPSTQASGLFKELLFAEVRRRIKGGELSADWRPPQQITIGVFPELLYTLKKPLANSWTEKLAWMEAFRQMKKESPEKIATLIPNSPEYNFKRKMELAALFSRLHRQMASEDLDFSAPYKKTSLIESEKKRWEILKELQDKYLSVLDSYSLWDEQTARSFAAKNKECQTNQEIYLIGAVDLNRLQKKILDQVADHVHIFIFAPEEKADFFDEYGCVIPSQWESIQTKLSEDQLIQAEDPIQEGEWAACAVRSFPGNSPELSAKDIIVGVADPDIVPFLTAELLNDGIPVNQRAGTPAKENRVFKLLAATLACLKTGSFTAFAEWIRHPDIESRFRKHYPRLKNSDWLSALDRIQNEWIPDTLASFFNSTPPYEQESDRQAQQEAKDHKTLKPIWDWASSLFDSLTKKNESNPSSQPSFQPEEPLPDGVHLVGEVLSESAEFLQDSLTLPLPQWPQLLSDFLSRIYSSRSSSESETKSEEDRQIDEGLTRLYSFFDTFVEIPSQLAPSLTAWEVLEILLKEAEGKKIPLPKSPNGVDLGGWLDLAWDNRPNLILTGCNSHFIPRTQSGDIFLPNTLKKQLGMSDNSRLFARDAYLFSAILASRPNTQILFAQKSFDGSILSPSPLLFTGDEKKVIAERIDRFFGNSESSSPSFVSQNNPSNTLTTDISTSIGQDSKLLDPPKFKMTGPFPGKLNVTDFEAFLRSPYRYFLERQCHLEHQTDQSLELDAATFGNITHEVLKDFGEASINDDLKKLSPNEKQIKDPEDEKEIEKFLNEKLDRKIKIYRARHSAGTVLVQIESIRSRLKKFAHWQAQWRQKGWKIIKAEVAPPSEDPYYLEIPSSESGALSRIQITGRIDRIDYNEKLKKWVIFDYKTFDSYKKGGRKDESYFSPEQDYETLFDDNDQNKADLQHRKKVTPSFLTFDSEDEEGETNDKKTDKAYQWINLQLPLYLKLAEKILHQPFYPNDREFSEISLFDYNFIPAYLVLPKSDEVLAFAGNWSPNEIEKGWRTAQWVAQRIQELWQTEINPEAYIDPSHPELGKILSDKDFSFFPVDDQKKFF